MKPSPTRIEERVKSFWRPTSENVEYATYKIKEVEDFIHAALLQERRDTVEEIHDKFMHLNFHYFLDGQRFFKKEDVFAILEELDEKGV